MQDGKSWASQTAGFASLRLRRFVFHFRRGWIVSKTSAARSNEMFCMKSSKIQNGLNDFNNQHGREMVGQACRVPGQTKWMRGIKAGRAWSHVRETPRRRSSYPKNMQVLHATPRFSHAELSSPFDRGDHPFFTRSVPLSHV